MTRVLFCDRCQTRIPDNLEGVSFTAAGYWKYDGCYTPGEFVWELCKPCKHDLVRFVRTPPGARPSWKQRLRRALRREGLDRDIQLRR